MEEQLETLQSLIDEMVEKIVHLEDRVTQLEGKPSETNTLLDRPDL